MPPFRNVPVWDQGLRAGIVLAVALAAPGAGALGLAAPAGAHFGAAVAVSGDTMVVGASTYRGPDGMITNQGAVWVFARSGGSWTLQQRIDNPGRTSDSFGVSVAVFGDVLVVGARGDAFVPGTAYVFTRSGGAWVQQQRLIALLGGQYDGVGSSVAISGDTIVLGSGRSDAQSVVFVRSGTDWVEQQRLVPSGAATDTPFHAAVAVSGDTVIVGTHAADTAGGVDAGAAYVFVRSGTTWTEQQKLTASDGAAGDRFGWSVTAEGDTVAIGAYTADTPAGADAGATYVFVRSGTAWTEQQKLAPSDGAGGDLLGCSVALSGDALAVGACAEDGGSGPGEGAAYVFARSGGSWAEQQKLRAGAGAAGDGFGVVALTEGMLTVGAPSDDVGAAADAGSVHAFLAAGPAWSEAQQLTLLEEAALDYFGRAISASGATVAVGSPLDADPGGPAIGAVYIYVRADGGWKLQQKLQPLVGAAGDWFGAAVSLDGDILLVGAPGADTGAGIDAGRAHVFVRSGSAWSEQPALVAPGGSAGARFGSAVALSGDDAVVGAPYQEASGAGRAYAFRRAATDWSLQQTLAPTQGLEWHFGLSVALSGDVALVGSARVPIGPHDPDTGFASVFGRLGAGLWTFHQQLQGPHSNRGGFGAALAVDGTTAVVGAPADDAPLLVDQGFAFVFEESGGAWTSVQQISAPQGSTGARFGHSVSISGDALVVGAQQDDTSGGTDAGAAYVFARSGPSWSLQQRLTAQGGAAGDTFGTAVSLSGTTVAVGVPLDRAPGRATGSAYVFALTSPSATEEQNLKAPLAFFAVPPCRVVDTRVSGPALAANSDRTFAVSGGCQVPADARAVAVNVTAVNPGEAGDLRLYPAEQPVPLASAVNFAAGRTRAGNVMVPLGTEGLVGIRCDMAAGSEGATHLVMDVYGYFR